MKYLVIVLAIVLIAPSAHAYPGPNTPTPEPTIEPSPTHEPTATPVPCGESCAPTDVTVTDVSSGTGGFIVWGVALIFLGVMAAVRFRGEWV